MYPLLKEKRYIITESEIYSSQHKYFMKEKTVETVSLPSTNKVIVLDAGHGKPDERSRE